jgi:hypothetical protein
VYQALPRYIAFACILSKAAADGYVSLEEAGKVRLLFGILRRHNAEKSIVLLASGMGRKGTTLGQSMRIDRKVCLADSQRLWSLTGEGALIVESVQ